MEYTIKFIINISNCDLNILTLFYYICILSEIVYIKL